MGCRQFTVQINDAGRRLDRIVRRLLPDLPLSAIYRLLRGKKVRVNQNPGRRDQRVKAGDLVELPAYLNPAGKSPLVAGPSKQARQPGFEIVYESGDFLVVNKEKGLPTHGKGSLADAVLDYLRDKVAFSLSFRPGPLHRVDKQTSGLLVFGKSLAGSQAFCRQLAERKVQKYYLALLTGRLQEREIWNRDLPQKNHRDSAVRPAITKCLPLLAGKRQTLVLCQPLTGRRHQIRRHAQMAGHPLNGDRLYHNAYKKQPFLLHAWSLKIDPKIQPNLPKELRADLPGESFKLLAGCFNDINQAKLKAIMEEGRRRLQEF